MKDIKGFEGSYFVDECGNVYNSRMQTMKPHFVNQYARVTLRRMGIIKSFLIHRLVADAFIENPRNLRCVNHKNLNRSDNRVSNLEWCTHCQNTAHAILNGRLVGRSAAGINVQIVVDIKNRLSKNERIVDISRHIGVSYQTVSNIKYGRSHK